MRTSGSIWVTSRKRPKRLRPGQRRLERAKAPRTERAMQRSMVMTAMRKELRSHLAMGCSLKSSPN